MGMSSSDKKRTGALASVKASTSMTSHKLALLPSLLEVVELVESDVEDELSYEQTHKKK